VDPPEFLDKEGAEFLLIAASEDVTEDLGVTLHPQSESRNTADMFRELKLDASEHPVKPFLGSEWE
jgi:hypothetical protein